MLFFFIGFLRYTMLAKQAWRMIQHIPSLFYRIYKARYFPSCSFIEAELGYKPSYVWRSLLVARDVILEGSRWRVRDGTKIVALCSKWLSNRLVFIGKERVSIKVSDLINTNTWQWEILAIPLTQSRMRDTLIWKENRRHEFTVKSAYHVALRLT